MPRRAGGEPALWGSPGEGQKSPQDLQSHRWGEGVLWAGPDMAKTVPNATGQEAQAQPSPCHGKMENREKVRPTMPCDPPSEGVGEAPHTPRSPVSPRVGQPQWLWEFGHSVWSACFQLKPQHR